MARKSAAPSATATELVFSPRTSDLKEFEALARQAKAVGFTHIVISELAERTDYRGADKDSPWCDWSALIPSLFKHVTPPGLEDAYPAAFVKRQMAFMKAKHKIVAALGLRAAYYGLEPHWLVERVYRQHPQWRGSRVDNPVRATGLFFAINADHPEVRQAYRWAARELARQCPLLDIYHLHTNDCGAFYNWGKRLFSGVNGPTGLEANGHDMGKRVEGFLSTLRDGASEGGVDAHIFSSVYRWFNDDETHLVLRSLKPGIGLIGLAPEPHRAESSLANCGAWGGGVFHPWPIVDREPTPMAVVSGVASVKTSGARRFMSGGNAPEFFEAFKLAMDMPAATSEKKKLDVLLHMAAGLYAPEVAEDVVDAWYLLDRANTMSATVGVDIIGGPIMLRWLTRPLVAHQSMLTAEERAYWQPHLYQSEASHPDAWLDYLNVTNVRAANTWEEASVTCCAIDGISDTLGEAADKLQAIADRLGKTPAARKLLGDVFRIRAWRSLTLTVRHFLQVGTLIYLRDAQNAAAPKTTATGGDAPIMPKGDLGSQGLWYLYRALRWELDNTNDLIDLAKRSPVPLFHTAPHPSMIGSMYLEPNYLENLERKVDIMLKYWRSAEIGYYRPTLGG